MKLYLKYLDNFLNNDYYDCIINWKENFLVLNLRYVNIFVRY